jgi:hypothetical protein
MRLYREMRVWLTEIISPLRRVEAAEFGRSRKAAGEREKTHLCAHTLLPPAAHSRSLKAAGARRIPVWVRCSAPLATGMVSREEPAATRIADHSFARPADSRNPLQPTTLGSGRQSGIAIVVNYCSRFNLALQRGIIHR